MARKNKATPSGHVTKRRLARWQQERRRRRFTIALGSLVIVIILSIIGYGYYATSYAPPREWVTTVGDRVFTGADYVRVLRLLPSYQTSPEASLLVLENNELVTQGAQAFGIVVSPEEITQEIRNLFDTGDEPLTDEELQELYLQFLSYYGFSDEEFRELVATDLLQAKLNDYLKELVPAVGEKVPQVNVQAIVVDSEEDAAEVVQRLDEEDFSSLAGEYGGGDPDWLPRGIMGLEFDKNAFSLETGEVSDPFSIDGDYYIIMVLEKDEKALDEATRVQLEANALYYWLEQQREDKVERNPNLDLEAKYQWAMGQIG